MSELNLEGLGVYDDGVQVGGHGVVVVQHQGLSESHLEQVLPILFLITRKLFKHENTAVFVFILDLNKIYKLTKLMRKFLLVRQGL